MALFFSVGGGGGEQRGGGGFGKKGGEGGGGVREERCGNWNWTGRAEGLFIPSTVSSAARSVRLRLDKGGGV